MLTHLSLFSGIGGIDLAAEAAGFRTVAFVEIDPYCQRVLARHWPGVPMFSDVREVTADRLRAAGIKAVDLLSGGFPCQPFSVAGQRAGEADERYLWPEMARVIREIRPRWVLAENVPGLRSIDSGRVFGAILRDLARMGYRVGWCSYGAGEVGAAHIRERVFVVAHSGGTRCEEQHIATEPSYTGFSAGATHERGRNWRDQPRLVRGVDGVPYRVDKPLPISRPGQQQHPWEPPRIATEIRDRVARIRALGNAVVPAHAYPILVAIAEEERKGECTDGHVPMRTGLPS